MQDSLLSIMEFNLLYLKYFVITQCFCVSLTIVGDTKFSRKGQPLTFECLLAKENFKYWQIDGNKINGINRTSVQSNSKANMLPGNARILNITILANTELAFLCVGTNDNIKFKLVPIFNDKGNLVPSSETPNAIKDKKFTLKCNVNGGITYWYAGNGKIIAKYEGRDNQDYDKYFGNRQETSCQNKSCTLTITNVTLDEDNMSIICSTGLHSSMFNITVFVLPKSVTVKAISNKVPVENQNKSYDCLIKETKPKFSVSWFIIKKDGKQKNITKYISTSSSKSGNLTNLSSKLTLTLKKTFTTLQCLAYYPGKSEFDHNSSKLDMDIRYSPEEANVKLNISGGKVCVDTSTKFRCSWKGGYPLADVTLIYKGIRNTSKEEVELSVTASESHQTVSCLGTHITANVSSEKNLTIHYPPKTVEINSDGPFLEGGNGILYCKAKNGYPEKYSYRWGPNNSTSQNLTLPQLSRTQNNKVFTCYVSNICNKKGELYKKHWINVEYEPDITASENVILIENQAAFVNCSANGNPEPEVRLKYGNQNFPSNSPLTFNRRNISDVSCIAFAKSTKNGNLTSTKKIHIILKYPPQIKINISKMTNNAVIINCTAFDGNPAIYEYKLKQKWGNTMKNIYNKNVLSINNPSFNDTGTWECQVSNEMFNVNKSSNYKPPESPIFSSTRSSSKKINVSNGDTQALEQCFYSHPKSDVAWQKNGKVIDSNRYLIVDYPPSEFPFKGNCTELRIEDIDDDDVGTYTLTVENSIKKVSVSFTLRHMETKETPWGIIIGCTVGIVLLLILLTGLLAYKFHRRRATKHNNEFSSTKAINTINGRDFEHGDAEGVHEVSNAIYDSSGHLADLDMEDIYANVQKPNNVEDLYAKVNKPSKQTNDVEDLYAKVNKPRKQTDVNTFHPKDNTNKKKADVEDLYAKVNKPRKQTDDKTNKKNPADVEELYAKVNKPSKQTDDKTNTKKTADNKNKKKPTDNKNKKKPTDVKDLPDKPSRKPEDVEDFYANVNIPSMKPDEDSSLNANQSNKPESKQESNYAELEFINNPEARKPAPKPKEEETIYADLILEN